MRSSLAEILMIQVETTHALNPIYTLNISKPQTPNPKRLAAEPDRIGRSSPVFLKVQKATGGGVAETSRSSVRAYLAQAR